MGRINLLPTLKVKLMKRREFLRRSGLAAATLTLPLIVPREVLGRGGVVGPNDRIQLGFVGLGGRGRWILKDEALPGAEVVAVADPDPRAVEHHFPELVA